MKKKILAVLLAAVAVTGMIVCITKRKNEDDVDFSLSEPERDEPDKGAMQIKRSNNQSGGYDCWRP